MNETATTEIYTCGHTLSLHDSLPIYIPSAYWDEFLNRITERYNLDLTNGRGSRYEIFCESLFSGDPATTKRQIGRLVGYMVSNTMIQTRDHDHPLFYYEAPMRTKALDPPPPLQRFIHARDIGKQAAREREGQTG